MVSLKNKNTEKGGTFVKKTTANLAHFHGDIIMSRFQSA